MSVSSEPFNDEDEFRPSGRKARLQEAAKFRVQREGGEIEEAIADEEADDDDGIYDDSKLTDVGYKETTAYTYTDTNGNVLYHVVRYEHPSVPRAKEFRYRRPGRSTGNWLRGAPPPTLRVIYRWPEIIARPDDPVFVVEGEKDADTLMAAGLLATTVASQKWSMPAIKALAGRNLILIYDADEKGMLNEMRAIKLLRGHARSIKRLMLPGLARGEDVTDWLAKPGNTTQGLLAIVAERQPLDSEPKTWRNDEDPTKIPRRLWLYKTYYARQFVSIVAAKGGTGKSSLVMTELLAMATGKPLLVTRPSSRCRVWYHCGEDPEAEIRRRFAGIQKHYRIDNKELVGWLYFESGLDKLRKIADQHGVIDHQVLREIRQFILEKKIDVVVFDPFVKMHHAPETDNTVMDMVVTALSEVANECNCAIVLVDHVRKSKADDQQSSDDVRGASSKRDAARNIRVVSPMTDAEAKTAQVELGLRWRYLSVEEAKYNMTAPPEAKEWYERDQAFLDNNPDAEFEDDNPRGDAIGVVKAWAFPKADKLDPSLVEVAKVQAALGSEPKYKAHPNAGNEWVGLFIAEALGYDVTKPVNKTKLRKTIDGWIASGWLKVVSAQDPKRRKPRDYLVTGNPAKGVMPVEARRRADEVGADNEAHESEVAE
jgi:RecA-family ATPase